MQDFQLVPERPTSGSRRRWPRLAPLAYAQTVYLPTSIEVARDRLMDRFSEPFIIDEGMAYTKAMVRYRRLQQYTGVIDGDSFTICGPFGYASLPMIIDGKLQAEGRTCSATLSVVRTTLEIRERSLVGSIIVVVVCAVLLKFWLLLFGLLLAGAMVYLSAALLVRRQMDALIDQLLFPR
jgi:hypothetical protein